MRERISLPKNIEKSVRDVLGPGGADGSVAMHMRRAKGRRTAVGAVITVTWGHELHRSVACASAALRLFVRRCHHRWLAPGRFRQKRFDVGENEIAAPQRCWVDQTR
jgi:hypothetical protein